MFTFDYQAIYSSAPLRTSFNDVLREPFSFSDLFRVGLSHCYCPFMVRYHAFRKSLVGIGLIYGNHHFVMPCLSYPVLSLL